MPDGTCRGETENRELDNKGPSSPVGPGSRCQPRGSTWGLGRALRRADPPAQVELPQPAESTLLDASPTFPQPVAHGWVLGRDWGSLYLLGQEQPAEARKAHLGPAAGCGAGQTQQLGWWGGASGPSRSWNKVEQGAKGGHEANPDFLS